MELRQELLEQELSEISQMYIDHHALTGIINYHIEKYREEFGDTEFIKKYLERQERVDNDNKSKWLTE